MLSEFELSNGTKRDRQRAETKRQLVESGLRVVAELGFAGATTAAIAKATGKAHGTVFLHFPSRDELVIALVAEVGRTMSRALTPEDGPSGLDDVLTAHLKGLRTNEVLYSHVLKEAATLPLAARTYLFALQSGVASRLKEAYLREREAGTVRAVDPVFLSNVWISLTNHYLVNREFFAPGRAVVEVYGDELKNQLLSLVKES